MSKGTGLKSTRKTITSSTNYLEAGYDPDDGLDPSTGRWMRDTWGVVRWVETSEAPAERKPLDTHLLIACPTCRARVDQTCRTRSGHTTTPHGSRLAPRLCRCGSLLDWRRRYCEACAVEATKTAKRDWVRRKRAQDGEAA